MARFRARCKQCEGGNEPALHPTDDMRSVELIADRNARDDAEPSVSDVRRQRERCRHGFELRAKDCHADAHVETERVVDRDRAIDIVIGLSSDSEPHAGTCPEWAIELRSQCGTNPSTKERVADGSSVSALNRRMTHVQARDS